MNASFNSSMDDEDDDFDFYSNPAAQYNKIKEQKEKEAAAKRKLLEQKFDDEEFMNESLSLEEESGKDNPASEQNTKDNIPPVVVVDNIIEITDSQSPKNYTEESYEEEKISSNRRTTRSSTRRRGRGRGSKSTSIFSGGLVNKRNSRKTSLDKGIERLEEVASKLKAVRNNNVPIVLNDSPVLLDSDNECDDSEEIVNVKVVWRHGEPHSFPIMKKKDLGSIYEFFAKQENVSIQNILLSKNEKVLSPHSTPLSIEYKVTDILEGGILQNGIQKPSNNQHDKDCIEVKVQQKNVKKPLLIQLHKSNDMNIFAKKVASELGIDVSKLKFTFDGDTLDLEETVESLDLDGGECFDLVILS
ncbi:uncharacterized protein CG4449 isoform X2 [Diaphorina citri]|uniref:Uncharacterized protein CG4449 isoform X2 n=1 Tax=Diaphorina citri TaxID=121845 RepID=A0A1S3CZT7_DIACI|nr:uncharacterized protein CG4449 isoform X2 [Diaphorina citri]